MYGYIYITTNCINNKKYIGQHKASQLDEKYLGSGKILQQAMTKEGKENFTCKIIDTANDLGELANKEVYWISYYDAVNSDDYYNISPGGKAFFAGCKHTDAELKKISEASKNLVRTPEHCRKISENQKGKANHIQSEEEKRKRSDSLKKAYAENRHRVVRNTGIKVRKRTPEENRQNSERQKGKHWMYNENLNLNCIVYPQYQNQLLMQGWKIGRNLSYSTIKVKNI